MLISGRLVGVHDYQNKNPLHPLRIYTVVCLCMQVYLYPCKCCRYRLYSHAMLAFVFKPFQTQPFPPKMVHIKSRNYNIFKFQKKNIFNTSKCNSTTTWINLPFGFNQHPTPPRTKTRRSRSWRRAWSWNGNRRGPALKQ